MKAKITKKIIEDNKEVYIETLYNFYSFREAQKRLLYMINNCKYHVTNGSKNGFTCDKGFSQLIFKIEKQ